jgi:hypothetical protein
VTRLSGDDVDSTLALHSLLLRLAGRLPDDVTYVARAGLATGHVTGAAQAVRFAAVTGRVGLATDEVELVTGLAGPVEEESWRLVERSTPDDQRCAYRMAAVSPDAIRRWATTSPYCLDLTVPRSPVADPTDDPNHDPLDGPVLAAVRARPAVSAVWRSWRFPALDTPWPVPKRIYLVLLDRAARPALIEVCGAVQAALVAAGEADPQVETFTGDDPLPDYHATALRRSALLWAPGHPTPIRLAPAFDPIHEAGGPGFAQTHPVLADQERWDVLGYLGAAPSLVVLSLRMDDVVDPRGEERVPINFRTDGSWVWSESVTYYLDRYGLAPVPDLLDHIRAARYRAPQVDDIGLHRAMAALMSLDETRV